VWKRTVNGRALHFRLVGINNQNFLMRDEETGTWWQQISGKAVFGPLKGEQLGAVLSDELTFGLWKQESPGGQVLAPVAKYVKEYESNWEPDVAKLPVVISFPGTPLASRDVLIGIERAGISRAYPLKTLLAESPVQDRLGGSPILLVVGPDQKSIRAFVSRIDGSDLEFFRTAAADASAADSPKTEVAPADAAKAGDAKVEAPKVGDAKVEAPKVEAPKVGDAKVEAPKVEAAKTAAAKGDTAGNWTLFDSSGSQWDFRGCAVAGAWLGRCLEPLNAMKDFWFDWRNYHPDTTIYQR
jgi:hypothetical protein